MKKKLLVLLLAILMCVSAAGCGQTAAPAATEAPATVAPIEAPVAGGMNVVSPMNSVAGLQQLQAAQPDIHINDAPTGSTNVTYNWITNIPPISQIEFTYEGCDYTYRAAACASEAAALDISGVYQQFPSINTMEVSKPNAIGGSYLLKYDGASGEGLASWYLPLAKCQYTLYSAKGCGSTMPMLNVMNALYAYTSGAKTAKGVVLDVNATNITISIENGGTSVLVLSGIKLQDIAAGDSVEFSYLGDLGGNAVLASITKTGSGQQGKLSGSVPSFSDKQLYVITDDHNAFLFTIDAATVITGVAKQLSANCDVVVTYSGDLSVNPLAKSIEITKVKAVPTPTPVPTAAPYVIRYTDGYVTSVAGMYVTVNGEMFTINSGECNVQGNCYEGAYASISYRDYGGGYHVVTDAYFSDPVPPPDPYVERTLAGYVDFVGGIYVTVSGVQFTVNSGSCIVIGTAEVGCYAEIDYNDYGGGYYEVTYAYFEDADTPIVYEWDGDYSEYDDWDEEFWDYDFFDEYDQSIEALG